MPGSKMFGIENSRCATCGVVQQGAHALAAGLCLLRAAVPGRGLAQALAAGLFDLAETAIRAAEEQVPCDGEAAGNPRLHLHEGTQP